MSTLETYTLNFFEAFIKEWQKQGNKTQNSTWIVDVCQPFWTQSKLDIGALLTE